MRDAVGGTFMIKVLLVFLAVYICFIAVALNYAKAFRVKNKIIDIIEQNEGFDIDSKDTSDTSVRGRIDIYLKSVNYNITDIDRLAKDTDGTCYDRGYCIIEYDSNNIEGKLSGKYYKVTTFVKLEFPFFNLTIPIRVVGETRKVLIEGFAN